MMKEEQARDLEADLALFCICSRRRMAVNRLDGLVLLNIGCSGMQSSRICAIDSVHHVGLSALGEKAEALMGPRKSTRVQEHHRPNSETFCWRITDRGQETDKTGAVGRAP